MSSSTGQNERRKSSRARRIPAVSGLVRYETAAGIWEKAPAEIVNAADSGVGVRVGLRLQAGQAVLLEYAGGESPAGRRPKGRVAWCRALSDGRFLAGLAMDTEEGPSPIAGAEMEDHYEILEVNPSASFDTIHKIYRILAQRLHPDNPDTGSDEAFKRLVKAYQVLSSPESRASFDVRRNQREAKHFQLFDAASATPGLESEQKKRSGILALLYGRRLRSPEKPLVTLHEMEQLLGVPREHLEFPLWYLREQGWIVRGDNAQFSITVKGVEQAEITGTWQPASIQSSRLIAAASK
ncbi:MAG: J domain-containing protein [Acidobacteria bacterium]|nr:J domain-containing protein [Acidobacteriota bacterium]